MNPAPITKPTKRRNIQNLFVDPRNKTQTMSRPNISDLLSLLALVALLLSLAGTTQAAPDDERRIVPAEDILGKIEKGEPVNYDNVIVVGDLNLSEVDLPTRHVERTGEEILWWGLTEEAKTVKSPINITSSEIQGDVTFSNVIFQKSVDFKETNFSGGNADFGGAEFSGAANFRESYFGEMAQFDSVTFNDSANFSYAQFSDRAYFEESTFNGSTDFEEAQFKGNAYFEGSTFHGDLNLTRTGYLRLFLRWNSIRDQQLWLCRKINWQMFIR